MSKDLTTISSLNHLKSYLSLLGARFIELGSDALQVTDGLILFFDNETKEVIPTGFDDGWLYNYTNYINNLNPLYIY